MKKSSLSERNPSKTILYLKNLCNVISRNKNLCNVISRNKIALKLILPKTQYNYYKFCDGNARWTDFKEIELWKMNSRKNRQLKSTLGKRKPFNQSIANGKPMETKNCWLQACRKRLHWWKKIENWLHSWEIHGIELRSQRNHWNPFHPWGSYENQLHQQELRGYSF